MDDGTAKPSDPPSQIAAIRSLLLALSRTLDGEAAAQVIETVLPRLLPQDTGDVAGQLSLLLAEGLAEGSITAKVLKCIHQEIIFPAVSQLRFSIYTVLPYKDCKGEWRVRVELSPDCIKVRRSINTRFSRLTLLCLTDRLTH